MLLVYNLIESRKLGGSFNVLTIAQPEPLPGSFDGRLVLFQAVLI